MLRVVVADDHGLFREMLKVALPSRCDASIVGEAANAAGLLEVLSAGPADVVLLAAEIERDGLSGLGDVVDRVREVDPGTRVVILAGDEGAAIVEAAERGAMGCVLRSARFDAIAEAIRAVAGGGLWLDPRLPRSLAGAFHRRGKRRRGEAGGIECLTQREREVLACVATGLTNPAIAERLQIGEQTVKTHLTRIFAKLAVANRRAAAQAYMALAS